jgi:transcriptional regulator with XRE-family HTH domain
MSRPISEPLIPFTPTSEPVPLAWLGELLIAARKQRGLTQARLAEHLGSHQAQIAQWEGSKYRSVSLQSMVNVAQALEVEITLQSALRQNLE